MAFPPAVVTAVPPAETIVLERLPDAFILDIPAVTRVSIVETAIFFPSAFPASQAVLYPPA